MKKIYLIIKKFSDTGGAELFCYQFFHYLKKQNYNVQVICGVNKTKITENIHETKLWHLGRFVKTWIFTKKTKHILKSLPANSVTISFGSVPGCDIYRTGGVHKEFLTKSIQGYHGIRRAQKRVTRFLNPINWYGPVLDKKIYTHKNTDCFLAISDMAAEEIKTNYNISEKKIKVIPNGVDASRFPNKISPLERRRARDNLNLLPGQKAIGFSATNFELKGLRPTLYALTKLPVNYLLIVAGNRKPHKYAKLAKSLGVDKRVKFIGYRKNPLTFYSALDVFCHPSAYDTFANVVAEALVTGVPVVTTTQVGASTLVHEGINGFVLTLPQIENKLGEKIIAATAITSWDNNQMQIPSQKDTFLEYIHTIQNLPSK